MEPAIKPLLFAVLLFGGMLVFLEIGRRLGVRRRSRESEGDRGSLSTIEGAMFALFGLVVAFTFSGAASRFDSVSFFGDQYPFPNRIFAAALVVAGGATRTSRVDAAAKAGEKGGAYSGAAEVAPGTWVYQITKNGVALQVTLQGTKYYKDDDLNQK